jgi:tRNA synthetase class II (F)
MTLSFALENLAGRRAGVCLNAAPKLTQHENHSKSLFENYEGCCGKGFWLWPRRRGPSIPAAGCKVPSQRRPQAKDLPPGGFSGKRLSGFVAPQSKIHPDILLRRASPSSLFPENSTPRSFQTGSKTSFGFNCIAMLRYDINDIRLFHENDVRFLRQL